MKIIDGKKIAGEIKENIRNEVENSLKSGFRAPVMGAVIVGNDGGSEAYVGNLKKNCESLGIDFVLERLDENVSQEELLDVIRRLNNSDEIDGYIVQMPLPRHIDRQKVIETISPAKDMDGQNPINAGRMMMGLDSNKPATPSSVVELLKRYDIPTAGKHAVVIGRSDVIGKPVALMLLQKGNPGDCTVTVCHSRTGNIKEICKGADILIAALGRPGFVTSDMVKEGAVVIDVGTTRVKDDTAKSGWRLRGDVDFDEVAPKTECITPVPGGVGPVTVCCLLSNLIKSWKTNVGID